MKRAPEVLKKSLKCNVFPVHRSATFKNENPSRAPTVEAFMNPEISQFHIKRAAETVQLKGRTRLYISVILLGNYNYIQQHKSVMIS